METDPKDWWLQIKGDPQIRDTLFQRHRVPSLFDAHIDTLHEVVGALFSSRSVFHVKIHYASNQLTCWLYEDPYGYQVFVGEEVVSPRFPRRFPLLTSTLHTAVPAQAVPGILQQFKRMRFQDENIYLRNASINRVNGMIGLTFSCDGSHYVPFDRFFVVASEIAPPV